MFSFLGKLFGTDKAGEKLVDGATSAIDKIWYTEEEKAEDAAQAKREAAAVYMKWLESTSGSRLARRMIAFIITAPWGTAMTLSWIMDAIAPFFSGAVEVRRRVGDEIITEIVLRSEQFTQAADSLAGK